MNSANLGDKFSEAEIEIMESYIQYHRERTNELNASKQFRIEQFVECVENIAKIKNPVGLWTKGFCAYEGTLGYTQDFAVAKDCFLKFLEIQEDVQVINALGYIYYYGRANAGAAEYKKAFDCFALAAALGHLEAKYKLADLYLSGKGVWRQSTHAALNIVFKLYIEALKDFCCGKVHCKFADLALRMGKIYMKYYEEEKEPANMLIAYNYYKFAEYALSLRLKNGGNFGDRSVKSRLDATISDIKSKVGEESYSKEAIFEDLEPLSDFFDNCTNGVKFKITFAKDGMVKITAKLMPPNSEEEIKAYLVNIPEINLLLLTDTHVFWIEDSSKLDCKDNGFLADEMWEDMDGNICFYNKGEKVATLSSKKYIFRKKDYAEWSPSPAEYKKCHIVGVEFEGIAGIIDYKCDIYDIKLGDDVVVPLPNGEQTKAKVVTQFDRKISKSSDDKYQTVISKVCLPFDEQNIMQEY